ncbi:MAG: tyrosine-type recombinase/integrase [Oscillospiraceae bacterium]|nr:tyrosine-type recombinase/integrase [Oscillospiraceae bacterium]
MQKNCRLLLPHVLRHTFCTDLAHAEMNLISLQYLMGHRHLPYTTQDNHSRMLEALIPVPVRFLRGT